ncbi:MAG TPA: hypothetical protein VIY48_14205 [Candidatus Paceibacterota bacterium]
MFAHKIATGAVIIDKVVPIIDDDNVKVIELDLASKYPGAIITGSSTYTLIVMICANEETLYCDDNCRLMATHVTFTVDDGLAWDWCTVATGSRYTVRIVFYRKRSEQR